MGGKGSAVITKIHSRVIKKSAVLYRIWKNSTLHELSHKTAFSDLQSWKDLPLFWQISSNPGVLQKKVGKTGGDQLHTTQKY